MNFCEGTVRIRRATPADSSLVAALYREAYTPQSGGDAREHYPFPQFLDTEGVAKAVARPGVCWMVAKSGEHVVGSAAAIRNIGSDADRVAEVYGIVVDRQFRARGIGSRLLTELCRELGDHPQFVLCESRTAMSAGWRLARKCGFFALGFEPFAHTTPAGSEAMLLTGRIAQNALAQRSPRPTLTSACRLLAAGILSELGSTLPEKNTEDLACDEFGKNAGSPARDITSLIEARTVRRPESSVIRDDGVGPQIAADLARDGLHHSGIVGLRRLEGEDIDGRRYERQYYVARVGSKPVATLLVVLDRIDRRARILEMQTSEGGDPDVILTFVLDALETNSRDMRLSVVVDVCADAADLQRTLERLGYLPTVYYPSLVAKGDARVDAVQYTRLINGEFEESLSYATELYWPGAQQVVRRVHRIWSRESSSETTS